MDCKCCSEVECSQSYNLLGRVSPLPLLKLPCKCCGGCRFVAVVVVVGCGGCSCDVEVVYVVFISAVFRPQVWWCSGVVL